MHLGPYCHVSQMPATPLASPHRQTVASVLLLWSAVLGGCAWRAATSDHYLGPVFLRRIAPPAAQGYLVQTVHPGLAFEVGRQWGLGIGLIERFSAAPRVERMRDCDTALAGRISDHLDSAPPGPVSDPEWEFSPLYTRVDRVAEAYFFERRVYGIEAAAGYEANSLSIGYKRVTALSPPADGLFTFRFSTADPMETVFVQLECVPTGEDQATKLQREGRVNQ